VETLALVGLSDAIKDVRYMSLFRKLLRDRPDAAAQKWYESIDFREGNLGRIRAETIGWILKLLANS
jgi:hypothetical protein